LISWFIIRCTVYGVYLQHNDYWFTCLTYVLLRHYLREDFLPAGQCVWR